MGPMLWKPEKPCARMIGDGTSGLVLGGLRFPGQSSLPRGTSPLAPVAGWVVGTMEAVLEQPVTIGNVNVAKAASARALDARFMVGPLPVSHLGSATYVCQVHDL